MNATTSVGRPLGRIPMWVKVSYTAFMCVLVPFYWYSYGLTNFLYFCDLALLLTLVPFPATTAGCRFCSCG